MTTDSRLSREKVPGTFLAPTSISRRPHEAAANRDRRPDDGGSRPDGPGPLDRPTGRPAPHLGSRRPPPSAGGPGPGDRVAGGLSLWPLAPVFKRARRPSGSLLAAIPPVTGRTALA